MAEPHEHGELEEVESMVEKIQAHDSSPSSSSSSSDSDDERRNPTALLKSKIYRLFGREKPVHKVLGGGKSALVIAFLWSNASSFISKSAPRILELYIPEEPVLQIASSLTLVINQALSELRDIASGKGLKKFFTVVSGLWNLSTVANWFNFLTLLYIVFVLLHTVPVSYENYEDQVDSFAEKAIAEFKKQYVVFDGKVLSKIPRGSFKDKKKA